VTFRHSVIAAAFLPTALLSIGACGASNAATTSPAFDPGGPMIPAQGTIVGRFLAVGGPSNAQPSPQHGTVTLRIDGRPLQHIHVGDDGRYRIHAVPNRYTLTGVTPQFDDNKAQCRATHAVTVTAGTTTRANVYCQRA
jgi:hypothetical protein